MKLKSRLILLSLIIGTLIIMGGLFLDLSRPMAAADLASTDPDAVTDAPQRIVVRFYYDSQEALNAVAGELDIWELQRLPNIGTNSGYALAAVNPGPTSLAGEPRLPG